MKLHFKQIIISDLPKVLSLFKAAAEKIAMKKVDHWQYWKNPPQEKIDWVKDGISNHEFFFILNSDNDLIGMVRILEEDLLYWGEKDDHARYIHSLVVTDQFEGRGLGAQIIQMIEDNAQKENCQFIRLDCDAQNSGLCNYYEKLGFLKVGQKEMPLSLNNLYQKNL